MTLKELIDNVDFETDESIEDEQYIDATNKAISIINGHCGTLFSYIDEIDEEYTDIPSRWMRILFDPYIAWTIKMNDTSLNEADRYLEEFYRWLEEFKDALGTLVNMYINGDETNGVNPDYIIDDGFGGVYAINTSNAINVGWFGGQGNGGSY